MKTLFVQSACFGLTLLFASSGRLSPASLPPPGGQAAIAALDPMPRLPSPLAVRDWRSVSQQYYNWVLDPAAQGHGFPVAAVENAKPGFTMKDYVGGQPQGEALACLSAVVGAKLVGLNPRRLHGINYVSRAEAWYDPTLGVYRNRVGDRSPVVYADIYGYWAAILGMEMASQYPQDPALRHQAVTSASAFLTIAHGLGAPDQPNYDVLGWDFAKKAPGGRPEPMNRLGNAPSVAWALMVGAKLTGDPEMLRCARATMQWYAEHPGRYEISHVMGPLTAARLNVQANQGRDIVDMTRVLNAWFGDGTPGTHSMFVTAGKSFNGLTTDGLDGARWPNGEFYAFTMGSLQNAAWLVPVARYDPRYARAIARFALHEANSARLLEGAGLDADHQDHAAWKSEWDKKNLLFYEGLMSSDPNSHQFSAADPVPPHPLRPYATGDPVLNAWETGHPKVSPKDYLAQRTEWFGKTPDNLSLYGGNHVGFLGGIEAATNVPGILRWDCLATDWYHPAALPTFLYYNPDNAPKTIRLWLDHRVSLYDMVAGRFVAWKVVGRYRLQLAPDQAAVLVTVRAGAKIERQGSRRLADGIVIDYRAGA